MQPVKTQHYREIAIELDSLRVRRWGRGRHRRAVPCRRRQPAHASHAFGIVHGMTPSRYLRAVRMLEARNALLFPAAAAVTVTQVATRFRLLRVGRFAVEIPGGFGESPSATLRRESMQDSHRGRGHDRAAHRGAVSRRHRGDIAIAPCSRIGR